MEALIREISSDDAQWAEEVLIDAWGSTDIVTRGEVHNALDCFALVAISNNERIGLITLRFEERECEIISLNSLQENVGVGSALLREAEKRAISRGCSKIWVITTNDNLRAIRFYQAQGYAFVAAHFDAIKKSRILKPSIPMIALNGIPICDEIELCKRLDHLEV